MDLGIQSKNRSKLDLQMLTVDKGENWELTGIKLRYSFGEKQNFGVPSFAHLVLCRAKVFLAQSHAPFVLHLQRVTQDSHTHRGQELRPSRHSEAP